MPRTKWPEAVNETQEYRNYLKSLKVNEDLKTKSYLITREEIERLLSQNGEHLDGIRVYIGEETIDGERLIRLVTVAAKKIKEQDVEIYEDYITYLPQSLGDGDDQHPDPGNLGFLRPCPHECAPPNLLNEP